MKRNLLIIALSLAPLVAGCQKASWPMWGATSDLSFRVEHIDLSRPPSVGWSSDLFKDGHVFAVVADEKTLYAYGDKQDRSGLAAALRLSDGHVLWRKDVQGDRPDLPQAAAVDAGRLFLVTDDGLLALDTASGRELWQAKGKFSVMTLAGRRVVAAGKEAVVAFEPSTGKVAWQTPVSNESLLIAAGGQNVCLLQGNESAHGIDLLVLDSQDGKLRWQKSFAADSGLTKGGITGMGMHVGADTVVVQAMNFDRQEGAVVFYDSATGKLAGVQRVNGMTGYGLASDGGRVYVPSMTLKEDAAKAEGQVTCLEIATRREIWSRLLASTVNGFPLNTVPILAGKTLLVRVATTDLLALDSATGQPLWRLRIAETWDFDHCIIAADRIIFTEAGVIRTLVADGKGKSLPAKLPVSQPDADPVKSARR